MNHQKEKKDRAGPPLWVIVVAVVVMLAGIVGYVLSLNESLAPGAVPAGGAVSPGAGPAGVGGAPGNP